MTTAPGLMTAEEFAQLPEAHGGEQMELVRGAIVMAPPGNAGHGHRARKVERVIEDFATRHDLGLTSGEGGYRLSANPDTVRHQMAPGFRGRTCERGASRKMTIRTLRRTLPSKSSTHDRDIDIAEKVQDYLDAGTDRVWVVRSKQRAVTVHRPNGDSHTYGAADTLTSDDAGFPVDGFELRVGTIFET